MLYNDVASRQLTDLLASFGLSCRVMVPTHDRGGLLDVVASRDDLPAPIVDVIDVGLSNHRLLRWSAPLVGSPPVYTTMHLRPWSQLDAAAFRAGLLASAVCRPDDWVDLDVDQLARLYDAEITTLLDRFAPVRSVTCRRRPSDPWFDQECHDEKRLTRRLERAARRADSNDVTASAAAHAAWTAQRRSYIALRRQKREEFWRHMIDADSRDPRQLWCSIDALLARGRAHLSAADFHRFFDEKVERERASTSDAPPPFFSTAPPDCRFDR